MHQRGDEGLDVLTFTQSAEELVVLLQAPEVAHRFLVLFERAGIQRLAGEIVANVAIQLGTHGGDFIGAEEAANEDDAIAFVVGEVVHG